MTFNVNQFRANLIGDGARPNLFQVTLNFPTIAANGTAAGQTGQFLIKSSQVPGSTIGMAPLYYFGREMKFAGNRSFPDWTVTVINDENFTIRSSIENWMNSINSHVGNVRAVAADAPSNYTTNATVSQYSKDGSILQNYVFNGLFPIDLSPIGLDWGNNDNIEEYDITFAYQYWTNTVSTDS